MRFAEVFLRLGSSLVAWMMLYAYVLWLAALHVAGCGPDGEEMHGLLLWIAPFACGFAFLQRATGALPDIQRVLSWLGVPLLVLLVFVLPNIWRVASRATFARIAVCDDGPAPMWQAAWAPVQLVCLTIIAMILLQSARACRRGEAR